MPETTNLAERLQRQAQTENETIQNLMRNNLESLRAELNDTLQTELSTIKADIRKKAGKLAWKATAWRMFWPTVTGLMIALGMGLGTLIVSNNLAVKSQQLAEARQNYEALKKAGALNKIATCQPKKGPARPCIELDPDLKGWFSDGEKKYMLLKH